MKINRVPITSDFTQIPNAALRDMRLSWKARGLLAYLLSHTDDGFSIDADRLALRGPDGRHAILAGLKELVTAGYVVRQKRRDERGHWHTDIEVFDQPTSGFPTSGNRTPAEVKGQVAPKAGFPTSGFPTFGQPTSGEPTAGKPDAEVEDQEEDQEEDLPPTPRAPVPASGPIQEGEDHDRIATLVASVRELQPAWTERSIRSALKRAAGDERPYEATRAALISIARGDHGSTQSPNRVNFDGPWWAQAPDSSRTSGWVVERDAFLATIADAPPCDHGHPGGDIKKPNGIEAGWRSCALCRIVARQSTGAAQ